MLLWESRDEEFLLLLLPFKYDVDGLAQSTSSISFMSATLVVVGKNNSSSSFAAISLDANADGDAGVGVETISSLSSPSLHNEEDVTSLSMLILRLNKGGAAVVMLTKLKLLDRHHNHALPAADEEFEWMEFGELVIVIGRW